MRWRREYRRDVVNRDGRDDGEWEVKGEGWRLESGGWRRNKRWRWKDIGIREEGRTIVINREETFRRDKQEDSVLHLQLSPTPTPIPISIPIPIPIPIPTYSSSSSSNANHSTTLYSNS
ncbi:hypothetical protein HZH68_002032 [Vespula germanica]|uniref:Uncharacterized protein n=1 Tax=Vespula germanica TaxID=30212 RepID=A0A834KVB1_VESGE|nr:hypothetical protein HZH68_002032 [Vespula germanica]